MMKVGHQLMAITTIAGGVYLAKNLDPNSIRSFADTMLVIPFIGKWLANNLYLFIITVITAFTTIPIVAFFHTTYTPLLPDGDGGGKITKNIFLAPGFWFMRFFVSHRGFTHRLEGIAFFGIICFLLSFLKLNLFYLFIGTIITTSILWVVIDNNKLKIFLISGMIILSPILLNSTYWNSFLVAMFIGYIIHMPGDAPTDEGWDVIDFAGLKLRIILPFAFEAGGWFEKKVVYPVLIIALTYFIFGEFDFWKMKIIKEFKDLLIIYKTLI